jgi:hypothetical protein
MRSRKTRQSSERDEVVRPRHEKDESPFEKYQDIWSPGISRSMKPVIRWC